MLRTRRRACLPNRSLRPWTVVGVAVLLGCGATLAVAPAAGAHDVLLGSDPAAGATVDVVPAAVVLTFAERPVGAGTAVRVTGPDGQVQVGAPRRDGTRVTQPLRSGSPSGRYLVRWQVTSSDGHPVSGQLSFTARAGSTGATERPASPTSPASSASASGGTPTAATVAATAAPAPTDTGQRGGRTGLLLLALVVLLPLGALVAARRRRA